MSQPPTSVHIVYFIHVTLFFPAPLVFSCTCFLNCHELQIVIEASVHVVHTHMNVVSRWPVQGQHQLMLLSPAQVYSIHHVHVQYIIII